MSSSSWYEIDQRQAIGEVKSAVRRGNITNVDEIIRLAFSAGIDFEHDQQAQSFKYGCSHE